MLLFPELELAEKKLRAVLVGCGEQATCLMHDAISYNGAIDVVAVCDLNKERADFAAKRFGLSRSYQDLDEMLSSVAADIAFVIMVPHIAPKLSKKCVEAGLDVYTEKPLGTNIEDLYMLEEALKKSGRRLGVSFNKRFGLAYSDMKRAIDSEGFGHPAVFNVRFIGGYRSTPTDLLRTGSCHFFDLGRYMIGEIEEVFAYKYEQAPGQHVFAVSAMFDNGCVGSFTLGSVGSWACGYGMEFVDVRGDRNMVTADNGRDFTWQKPSQVLNSYADGVSSQNTQAIAEKAVPVEILRPNYSNPGKLTESTFFINGNYQCINAFVKAILNGEEPPVGFNDGMMALKVALAIEKSVEERRAVKISEIH